jgi:riboflavin biosynthesis pyrimidine reductase
VRRLLPQPGGEVDLATAYADPQRGPRDGRPWVLVNMISSVDGAITVEGRSGRLGGPTDQAVFHSLRALADVILVGAGTVRAEGYGPPMKEGQRIAVVTLTGRLDWDSRLFTSGAALVVTTEDAPPVPVPSVRAGVGAVDLPGILRQLAAKGAGVVLCEGGPSLNGALLAAQCIDELCLTFSPLLAGGRADRTIVGPDVEPISMRLKHLLEDDGFLFCRYVRADQVARA